MRMQSCPHITSLGVTSTQPWDLFPRSPPCSYFCSFGPCEQWGWPASPVLCPCVCASQAAPLSSPRTTWMRQTSWGTGSPSFPTGSSAAWAPPCSWRTSWGQATTWPSSRRTWSLPSAHAEIAVALCHTWRRWVAVSVRPGNQDSLAMTGLSIPAPVCHLEATGSLLCALWSHVPPTWKATETSGPIVLALLNPISFF